MQIYTESTRRDFGVNTESTQSNADLHRVISGQHRVYTEQFRDYRVYTESTQSNTDIHRVYTE